MEDYESKFLLIILVVRLKSYVLLFIELFQTKIFILNLHHLRRLLFFSIILLEAANLNLQKLFSTTIFQFLCIVGDAIKKAMTSKLQLLMDQGMELYLQDPNKKCICHLVLNQKDEYFLHIIEKFG